MMPNNILIIKVIFLYHIFGNKLAFMYMGRICSLTKQIHKYPGFPFNNHTSIQQIFIHRVYSTFVIDFFFPGNICLSCFMNQSSFMVSTFFV